jgi:hypothetical protein
MNFGKEWGTSAPPSPVHLNSILPNRLHKNEVAGKAGPSIDFVLDQINQPLGYIYIGACAAIDSIISSSFPCLFLIPESHVGTNYTLAFYYSAHCSPCPLPPCRLDCSRMSILWIAISRGYDTVCGQQVESASDISLITGCVNHALDIISIARHITSVPRKDTFRTFQSAIVELTGLQTASDPLLVSTYVDGVGPMGALSFAFTDRTEPCTAR